MWPDSGRRRELLLNSNSFDGGNISFVTIYVLDRFSYFSVICFLYEVHTRSIYALYTIHFYSENVQNKVEIFYLVVLQKLQKLDGNWPENTTNQVLFPCLLLYQSNAPATPNM